MYLNTAVYSDGEDRWIWRDYLNDNPVSSKLGRVLDKAIARATAKRYQSAQAVLQDLNINTCSDSSSIIYTQVEDNLSKTDLSTPDSIDCTKLEQLLENKQWQQANQETALLLLKAAKQERRDWLERNDVANIACNDLLIIDRLWQDYSQKHFGFAVQLDLWQTLETQNYREFGKQVGWHDRGK